LLAQVTQRSHPFPALTRARRDSCQSTWRPLHRLRQRRQRSTADESPERSRRPRRTRRKKTVTSRP